MTNDLKTQPPKPIWESKTAVVNSLVAVGSLVPTVSTWESHHAWQVLVGVGIINVFLRFISKGRVILFSGNGNS